MKKLKVLDVTLRDGGCVNDFNFGQEYMEKILYAQEHAGIDIIELGYIDKFKGTVSGRTQFIDENVITEHFLKEKKSNINYVVMMDYGKYDVNELQKRGGDSIDGIRMAFHKKDYHDAIEKGKIIIDKGYDLYIQPMITLRYTDAELIELINNVNTELSESKGFYIVDSFGEMRPNDMIRVLNLVEHNLNHKISLGFHSHNNLQLSYSNSMTLLQFPTNREILIDCSIMGMGKGAGNLNTEILLEHLNLYYGKNYYIGPLFEVMDKVINQLHSEFQWGYAPEYFLSSANHCTPSYASHFYDKHMLSIDQVSELLSKIDEDKKISFDREYAEELYRSYNASKKIDDTESVAFLEKILSNKTILMIAPGKSILDYRDILSEKAAMEDIVTIGLNTDVGIEDYLLTTRHDSYIKAVTTGKKVIVCSNISNMNSENVYVLNYASWIEVDDTTHDSSAVIAFKLLMECKVKKIILAGFDGFSTDINENYYMLSMRNPVNYEQAERRNRFYKKLIRRVKDKGIEVQFITPSRYVE